MNEIKLFLVGVACNDGQCHIAISKSYLNENDSSGCG